MNQEVKKGHPESTRWNGVHGAGGAAHDSRKETAEKLRARSRRILAEVK
jgi:hypothetical protein